MFQKAAFLAIGLSVFLSGAAEASEVGPETGFPIPRFVSIRAETANVRRGPTTDHQIDWVFERPGLPVMVTGEFGHWRQIEDLDGDRGWVHRALISGVRTGMALHDDTPVHKKDSTNSEIIGVTRKGVIVQVGECGKGMCEISWKELTGWIDRDMLWGVDLPEEKKLIE